MRSSTFTSHQYIASSRRLVCCGATPKTAGEKIREKRGEGKRKFFRFLSPRLASSLFFRSPFFPVAPQLTERLEEAKFVLVNDVAVLVGRGRRTIHLFCN